MTGHVYLLKSELAKEMWKISSISLQKQSVDILEYILSKYYTVSMAKSKTYELYTI